MHRWRRERDARPPGTHRLSQIFHPACDDATTDDIVLKWVVFTIKTISTIKSFPTLTHLIIEKQMKTKTNWTEQTDILEVGLKNHSCLDLRKRTKKI
jgi:hypothetical protein